MPSAGSPASPADAAAAAAKTRSPLKLTDAIKNRIRQPTDGFRPDIEGLRAVAIVAVLLCHAGRPLLRRRLRRRRRLLRHLRLPHHPPAARRARQDRRHLAAPLLRAPGQAPAAALGRPARLGRRPLAAAPLPGARGRSLRRHRQLGPLHRQLALRRPVGRLLRPGRRTEPGAAPLVAGDRGAVLPRLADPAARRHLDLAPPRRARSARRSGSTLALVLVGSLRRSASSSPTSSPPPPTSRPSGAPGSWRLGAALALLGAVRIRRVAGGRASAGPASPRSSTPPSPSTPSTPFPGSRRPAADPRRRLPDPRRRLHLRPGEGRPGRAALARRRSATSGASPTPGTSGTGRR